MRTLCLSLVALAVLGLAPRRPVLPSAAADDSAAAQVIQEVVVDSQRGLAPGWMYFGYSPYRIEKGQPVEVDLGDYGGLILARTGLSGSFGGLTFRYSAPESFGDFLEVHLQSPSGDRLGKIRVPRTRGQRLPDGFTEVFLPMEELNPLGKRFERIVFHGWRQVGHQRVQLDRVALTAVPEARPVPPRTGRIELDCRAPGAAISPLIYGIGGADSTVWTMGATARRWGGNPTSRYNWRINAWNLTSDWFFRNRGNAKASYEDFLEENRAHGVQTALTVPMLGWVAKDAESYSFPVSVFGSQKATAPEIPDAGNGVQRNGTPVVPGPPSRTSVAAPPEFVEQWIQRIRDRDRDRERGRGVHLYILDNEPMLWNTTHRDVHPEPATYDEVLEKTLAYAAAVRRADPEAVIAGPASWGWLGYQYSARDMAAGVAIRPDRRLHGDVPFIPWLLQKVREQEQKTGSRLLDVLDVHFYSQAQGVGHGTGGETDPATAALRIRSTRSLWDASYKDESWIDERMRVLPLMRQWIKESNPRLRLAVGEWNFGAENHLSGGLATAEALGRFGTEGVDYAFYWTSPPERSPAFWAFRAYRNFDGAGGRFLDITVPTRSRDPLASAFGSRDGDRRRLVAVLLNFDPSTALTARVALLGCDPVVSARAFAYAGGQSGFAPIPAERAGNEIQLAVPPYGMAVADLRLEPAR